MTGIDEKKTNADLVAIDPRGRQAGNQQWWTDNMMSYAFLYQGQLRDLLSLFFVDTKMTLCGQDADAVPLPRGLRMPGLKLFSVERLRGMAARRGSMLFSVSRKRENLA